MTVLAVNAGACATPLALLVTCATVPPVLKVHLAPLAFDPAVNVTAYPAARLPPASFRVADSAVPKATLTVWLCPDVPVPGVAVAGGPDWLVREKAGLIDTVVLLAPGSGHCDREDA